MFREFTNWIEAAFDSNELSVALLHGYVDGSSGRDAGSRIVCSVAVAGFNQQVIAFAESWRLLLSKNGLRDSGLSMKAALRAQDALSKQIPAQTIPERVEALRPFALAIRKHFQLCVAISVDVAEFKALSETKKTLLGSKADFFAFGSAVMRLMYYVDPAKDRINIVSDDDEHMAWQCYRFYRRLKVLNRDVRGVVTAITFANDKDHPQVQAADMLASLWRLEAQHRAFGTPYDYQPLLHDLAAEVDPNEQMIATDLVHWGKESLEVLAKRYDELQSRFPLVKLPALSS